ncbi:uncharacterized protein RJT21DRAFT_117684 [Scheffersomyces amazonensis]|uniref:uncharacterized protein n=1 Tax=Scheffersomyces amazonensis TaxID=1078765 RepID=UPI00315C71BA
MGSSVSKSGSRKLAKTVVSDSVAAKVNRSATVNQLPPTKLQQQFEQHSIEQELSRNGNNIQFDPKFLAKKLNKRSQTSSNSAVSPAGKDGQDPHFSGTSTYDNNNNTLPSEDFIKSINRLGDQIHSTSMTSPANIEDSIALKQLKNRREMFKLGEEELLASKDPNYLTQEEREVLHKNEKENGGEIIRTMVHPRTLVAILNDLNDPKINNSSIILDYQLHPNFLNELGTRFKVAKNTVILEDSVKEDEIGHKAQPIIRATAIKEGENENENELDYMGEVIGDSRYKKLKSRISLDD